MYLYGRRQLKTNVKKITPDNIVEVVKSVYGMHQYNAIECQYLYDYYRGKQGIENRQKRAREDIKNSVTQNHAYEIANFKTDYLYGDPIKYVRNSEQGWEGEAPDDPVSETISKLNILMSSENKVVCDRKLGLWQNICGVGYRWVFPDSGIPGSRPDEAPFEITSLSPISTFVVYSNEIIPKRVLGGFVLSHDGVVKLAVYTRDRFYDIENWEVTNHTDGIPGTPHYLGAVPIIEYPANPARLGAFEVVISQLNAINLMQSNRIDGVEQLVQSYLVFTNCEVTAEGLAEMQRLGAIQTASVDGQKDAKVDLLSVELSQDQVQVLVSDLYQSALTICGMPDRQGGSRSTGDTQQAVVLRDGWEAAESCAKGMEIMFEESEREFLEIVFRILGASNMLKDLKLSDIKVQFTRNRTDNIITKTQGMLNQLSAGINPRVVIANSGIYSDPEQVFVDSKDYLEKWKSERGIEDGGDLTQDIDREVVKTHTQGENLTNAKE